MSDSLPKWLTCISPVESRNVGIGGTDASAIMGENKYRTRFDVWLEKMGEAPYKVDTGYLEFGRLLEPVIARKYCEKENVIIVRPKKCYQSKKHPWLIGSPDALLEEHEKGCEVKTASNYVAKEWGDPYSDHIPDSYLLQIQHYMTLCQVQFWDAAVLIGGNDFRIYRIKHNPDLEAVMLEECERFWKDHVLANKAPEIEPSETVNNWLRLKYPSGISGMRQATTTERGLILTYAAKKKVLKELEKEIDFIGTKLKSGIGESNGIDSEACQATWTKNEDSELVDWKGIVQHQNVPTNIIKEFTSVKQGARVLRYKIKE